MDIVQYEELKQKLKRLEELSKQKEDVKYKIKCLEADKSPWITIDTSDGNIYLDRDESRKVCDFILAALASKLINISSEMDNI